MPGSTPLLSSARSTSPGARHPTRPLSPDLPTRDALYLFANFSSYMRSPDEGAEGITHCGDFQDTIRLLDYARTLASHPHANVHILHLKYRFHQSSTDTAPLQHRPRYSAPDNPLPRSYQEQGKLKGPVPQPFSVLHDPVVKIDYKANGVFEPLPAQAIFSHIAKACQPPPRIIVISYVQSRATENHLASLSSWAIASSPPIYVFSPLETRLREAGPLRRALHHAIPISMYAWPDGPSSPSTACPVSASANGGRADRDRGPHTQDPQDPQDTQDPVRKPVRDEMGHSPTREKEKSRIISPGSAPRSYPPDPVATLTVITSGPRADGTNRVDPNAPIDRIPLWALAPGVGVLHGSTSASLGIKLSDFSAINIISPTGELEGKGKETTRGVPVIAGISDEMGIRTSPLDPRELGKTRPPVELVARKGTGTATPEPIVRPRSTTSVRPLPAGRGGDDGGRPDTGVVVGGRSLPSGKACSAGNYAGQKHLTPPDRQPHPRSLIAQRTMSTQSAQSWPTRASRVPEWRRGRREVMEDALDEVGKGLAGSGEAEEVTELALELEGISVADKCWGGEAEGMDTVSPRHDEVVGLLGMI